ncbi:autoinducer 2 ABC transporter substrate-binding protein [Nakamurella lactea]|uniref:autoinducer 2 ABC transporter substrate-binding protein n=1 Tax=Nakamurella lactea TaxID=459515 RepID=UPI00041EE9D0|nr:autoinducer 2 ABC transporter substrate-binding protein [Nakamurella lactea]
MSPRTPSDAVPTNQFSRRRFGAVALGGVAGLGLAACGVSSKDGAGSAGAAAAGSSGAAGSGSAPTSGFTLLETPKWTGFPYFEQARIGGEKAAKELADSFTYAGADHPDSSLQTETLQNFLTQRPSAILVAAIDGDAIAPVLKKARQQGIKVVSFEGDAAVDARDVFCNPVGYELIATTELDCALLNDPDGGKVAFVAASPTAPNHTAIIKYMREHIENDPKYAKLTAIDDVQYANDDDATSYNVAVNLMQAHPDLKFIISPSSVSVPAAARAIVASGRKGKVYATGQTLPNSVKEFMKDGSMKASMMWDPQELGYIAVYAAHHLITGDLTGEEGATFEAGSAGKFTVGKDGEIVYKKPLVFTPDNIDDFDF